MITFLYLAIHRIQDWQNLESMEHFGVTLTRISNLATNLLNLDCAWRTPWMGLGMRLPLRWVLTHYEALMDIIMQALWYISAFCFSSEWRFLCTAEPSLNYLIVILPDCYKIILCQIT